MVGSCGVHQCSACTPYVVCSRHQRDVVSCFQFWNLSALYTRTSLHLHAASFASSAKIACTPLYGSYTKMALRLQDVCLLALLTMHSFFNIRPPSPPLLPGRTLSLSGYCCNLKGKLLYRRIADASAAICLHLVSDASHGVASKLYLENDVIQSPFFLLTYHIYLFCIYIDGKGMLLGVDVYTGRNIGPSWMWAATV